MLVLPGQRASPANAVLNHVTVFAELVEHKLGNFHVHLRSSHAVRVFASKHACQPEKILAACLRQPHLSFLVDACCHEGATIGPFVHHLSCVKVEQLEICESTFFVGTALRWPRKLQSCNDQAQRPGILHLDLSSVFDKGHNPLYRQAYFEVEANGIMPMLVSEELPLIRSSHHDTKVIGLIILWKSLSARLAEVLHVPHDCLSRPLNPYLLGEVS
mmetsp:Transcript_125301/g.297392  ORF Transcript_125301/g.297392 Transcript_125301/m.297392 type:complete len:216 (-) Transcript_125301:1193-1840(-)